MARRRVIVGVGLSSLLAFTVWQLAAAGATDAGITACEGAVRHGTVAMTFTITHGSDI